MHGVSFIEIRSRGMRRRVEIARGLIYGLRVLSLDESMLGLHAQTRRRIWTYVERRNRCNGTTIVLPTHSMEEADCLCNPSRAAECSTTSSMLIETHDKFD